MKSLKEFSAKKPLNEDVIPEEQIISLEELALELQDSVDILESSTFREAPVMPTDPPALLIMRRTSVRMFPNGQRVALYFVDKVNKYVSVPYMPMQWAQQGSRGHMPTAHMEETQIEETVMHHLQHIVDNHTARTIKFKDGKSQRVDVQTANAILKVHGSLNDENKKKVSDTAHKSREHFNKVADFAWKHVSYKK